MQSVDVADMQELADMFSAGSLRSVVGTRLAGLGELPEALASGGHGSTGKTVVFIGAAEEMDRD